MTRSKKKQLKSPEITASSAENVKKIPIDNLPENHLWMHVKNGTKIRNVLEYALKHFPERKSIVWTGCGQSINKTISCSQLFKRKHPKVHQVTRLRYVPSKEKSIESEVGSKSNKHVPEIHIFLSQTPTHVNEPGYQSPEDAGDFAEPERTKESDKTKDPFTSREEKATSNSSGRITSLAAEEFAAMGLRTGQKRSRKDQQSNDSPMKKNKKRKEQSANGL